MEFKENQELTLIQVSRTTLGVNWGKEDPKQITKTITKIENGNYYLTGSTCRFIIEGSHGKKCFQGITRNGNWGKRYEVVSLDELKVKS